MLAQSLAVDELAVRIIARDGFELGATLYCRGPVTTQRRAAVLNCGGGVAAVRYRHFARFLATAGTPVLTYDYRGIGQSRPARLRGFVASTYDWAEYDCVAAIAWLRSKFPTAELCGISHSAGALLFGGATNISELNRFVFACAHTGYVGDYAKAYRLPMGLLWHFAMPAVTSAMGYFPARRLRLGEDLPAGVARQWAARRTPEFRPQATDKDVTRGRAMLARMSLLEGPALFLTFSDDAFATISGARRFLALLPKIQAREILLSPAELGVPRVGHFGFLSPTVGVLVWPLVCQFLDQATIDEPKNG